MHEHGLMTKLLQTAAEEAARQGGELRKVRVRLGAMASSNPEHFRGDFEHVRAELAMGPIELEIEAAPDRPGGVELIGIGVAR